MDAGDGNNQPSLDAAGEPSFRVLYYGATGAAVPFKWESQPGTPKHSLAGGGSLPPLSPPPAYFSGDGTSPTKPRKKPAKKRPTLHQLVRRSSSSGGSYSSSSNSSSSNGETALEYSPSMTESKKKRMRSVLMCFGLTALVNGECGYPVSSVKNALFNAVACRRSSHAVDYVV